MPKKVVKEVEPVQDEVGGVYMDNDYLYLINLHSSRPWILLQRIHGR